MKRNGRHAGKSSPEKILSLLRAAFVFSDFLDEKPNIPLRKGLLLY